MHGVSALFMAAAMATLSLAASIGAHDAAAQPPIRMAFASPGRIDTPEKFAFHAREAYHRYARAEPTPAPAGIDHDGIDVAVVTKTVATAVEVVMTDVAVPAPTLTVSTVSELSVAAPTGNVLPDAMLTVSTISEVLAPEATTSVTTATLTTSMVVTSSQRLAATPVPTLTLTAPAPMTADDDSDDDDLADKVEIVLFVNDLSDAGPDDGSAALGSASAPTRANAAPSYPTSHGNLLREPAPRFPTSGRGGHPHIDDDEDWHYTMTAFPRSPPQANREHPPPMHGLPPHRLPPMHGHSEPRPAFSGAQAPFDLQEALERQQMQAELEKMVSTHAPWTARGSPSSTSSTASNDGSDNASDNASEDGETAMPIMILIPKADGMGGSDADEMNDGFNGPLILPAPTRQGYWGHGPAFVGPHAFHEPQWSPKDRTFQGQPVPADPQFPPPWLQDFHHRFLTDSGTSPANGSSTDIASEGDTPEAMVIVAMIPLNDEALAGIEGQATSDDSPTLSATPAASRSATSAATSAVLAAHRSVAVALKDDAAPDVISATPTGAGTPRLGNQADGQLHNGEDEPPHVDVKTGSKTDAVPGTEVQLAANATATAVPGQDRMPFRDVFGSQFYAEVSVGEPALVMRMLLDTGSPTTTLFSQHCGDESCRTHRLYKSEDSATFERDGRPIRIPYATGMVSGIVSRDDFRIGKFTVANMTFTEITAAPGRTFMYTSFDGVLGLGRPGKNEIVYDGMPPFMDRLWASGQLAERMFSLYFSPTRNYHNWLTIGGQDAESMAKLVQPLTWAPLISDAYWQVAAIGMTLNTGTLDIRQVVFDTGTSMIGVSKKVRDQIVHSVWHFTMNDIAVISCKSTLNLTITLADGSTISLRDDELMLPVGAIGRCMLSIVALPIDDDTIVLGTPFFQRYYVSFDEGNQRIGFGRTRQPIE